MEGENMKRKSFVISYFICQKCNNTFPLPRFKNSQRENGHIKDIWCPWCKDESKFLEIKDKQAYKTVFGDIFV